MTVKINADSEAAENATTPSIEKDIISVFHIHELHHHVLKSWQTLQADLPQVVTLDHHTDILPAFMRHTEKNPYPVNAGAELEKDIELLQHDEHFDYAVKYNFIAGASIISHTPAVTEIPEKIKVLYNAEIPADEPLNSELHRSFFDCALEDEFLSEFENFLPEENYILDIDCDYFKTEKSLTPAKSEIFFELLRHARMITISREADWVRLLTFEEPSIFNPEYIIARLNEMYEYCKF